MAVVTARKRHHKLSKQKRRTLEKIEQYMCEFDKSKNRGPGTFGPLFSDIAEYIYLDGGSGEPGFDDWVKKNHPKFKLEPHPNMTDSYGFKHGPEECSYCGKKKQIFYLYNSERGLCEHCYNIKKDEINRPSFNLTTTTTPEIQEQKEANLLMENIGKAKGKKVKQMTLSPLSGKKVNVKVIYEDNTEEILTIEGN